MEEFEKKYLDTDYIILRDKIIMYLMDNYKCYTLYEAKKIKKLLKTLLKLLEKGKYI